MPGTYSVPCIFSGDWTQQGRFGSVRDNSTCQRERGNKLIELHRMVLRRRHEFRTDRVFDRVIDDLVDRRQCIFRHAEITFFIDGQAGLDLPESQTFRVNFKSAIHDFIGRAEVPPHLVIEREVLRQ